MYFSEDISEKRSSNFITIGNNFTILNLLRLIEANGRGNKSEEIIKDLPPSIYPTEGLCLR
jgi:hypothetical protein